jgi:hypothetical protein
MTGGMVAGFPGVPLEPAAGFTAWARVNGALAQCTNMDASQPGGRHDQSAARVPDRRRGGLSNAHDRAAREVAVLRHCAGCGGG